MAAEATTPNYEEAASGGLPQLDISTWTSQIFWLLLTFGILYFILATFILPRLRDGISERSDRISDDLDQAANSQREAAEAENVYVQLLADARAKAMNVAETTRQSVDEEIKLEIEAADADADRQAAIADTRLRDVKASAMKNIETVATDAASDIIEMLTGKAPTAAKVKNAMSNFQGKIT